MTDGPKVPDGPVKDRAGYRKLIKACEDGDVETVHCLFAKVYDPTQIGSPGHRPPHYWACRRGNVEVVKVLIEIYKCNPHYVTEKGHSLLHVAATRGHLEVARYLVRKLLLDPNQANNEGITPLFAACNNGHFEMVRYLTSDLKCDPKVPGALGESLLHISCSKGHLKVVQYLITQHQLDPNATSNFGETPLHSASSSGHLDVVKFLIEQQRCSTSSVDHGGNTPLYVACQNGHVDIVEYFIFEQGCDVGTRNFAGYTLLHTACRFGHTDVVKILLCTRKIDLESTTVEGKTATEFAREKEIIQELIRSGARTKGIPEILRQYRDQQPLDSLVHMYVLGHPSSGKTTLVTALKKGRIQSRVIARFMPQSQVTNVTPQTAGIIPIEFETADFGKVLLFDFAGQYEYYASHAALLEHTSTSSAPLFLLVVKLTESDADVKRRITYWLQFLESHIVPGTSAPHIIVIGSHKDILKRQLPDSYKTRISAIESFVKGKIVSDTSLHFAGFFAVDCRKPPKHRKLREGIKDSCKILRTDTQIDACCHVLSVFLLDEFRFQLSCTIANVIKVLRESHYPIPINAERLCELSEALSDRMSILFLKNKQNLEKSWIILDIDKLLHEINGRIFAPKYFKERCLEASSTGILSWAQIQTQFSDLDPALVIAFLGRLEFCEVVSDPEVLQLINDGRTGPPHLHGISTPRSSSSEEDIVKDSGSRPTSMESSYMSSLESPVDILQKDNGDPNPAPPSWPSPANPVDVPGHELHRGTQTYIPQHSYTPPHNHSFTTYTSTHAHTPQQAYIHPDSLFSPPSTQPYFPPSAYPYPPPHGHPYSPPHGHPYSPPHGHPYSPPHGHPYSPPHGHPYSPPHGHPYSPPHGHPYSPPHGHPYSPPHGHPYSPQQTYTPAQTQYSNPPVASLYLPAQHQPVTQLQPKCYPSLQYQHPQPPPLPHSPPLQHAALQHTPPIQHAALQHTALQHTPPIQHAPLSHTPPVQRAPLPHSPPIQHAALPHTPPIQHAALQHTPPIQHAALQHTPPIQHAALQHTPPIQHAALQHTPPIQHAAPIYHAALQHTPPIHHAAVQHAAPKQQQYQAMLHNSPPSHPPSSSLPHIPFSEQQAQVSLHHSSSRNRHTHPPTGKKTQVEQLHSQLQPPSRSSSSLPNVGLEVTPTPSEQSSPSHSADMKPYIFFPGLISSEQPEDMIWTKDDSFSFYTGWCLFCGQQNQFFTPRSLQILLLRLAFGFAVSKHSAPLNGFRDLFSGERECTIWKNGLRWLDLNGIETLVEMVDDNRAIVMLMRGKEGSEMSCVSLRSAVIRQILSVKEQYCRNISTCEYILDPQQLKSQDVYPLIKSSLDSMLMYDVSLVARAFVADADKPYVWDTHHKGMVKVESLLHFDPYFQVGKTLLSDLYNDTHDLSQDFLIQLSLCQPLKVKEFERIFTSGRQSPVPPSCPIHAMQMGPPPNPLMGVFNRFWERGKVTMGPFREHLDKYSLFSGRNILELLHYHTPNPSHSPSDSTLSGSTSSLNPES